MRSPARRWRRATPGIVEAKDIAEEGFIYGLPLVMNYAVMHEFAVDRKSGQFKAPFNEINNEHRVATYEDTAVITPNSDTPYSIALAGSARRADGDLGAGGREGRATTRSSSIDGNTYNYGYIGSRATGTEPGDYLVVGPDWKGETPAGHQEGLPIDDAVLARAYPHPALQSRRHAERRENPGRLQGAAAFRLPQATRPARRAEDRFPAGHHGRDQGRTSSSISTPPCNSCRRDAEDKAIRAKLARIGIGPGKTFDVQGSVARTQGRNPAWA